jgi:transcription elongation GreA/GreB family factor
MVEEPRLPHPVPAFSAARRSIVWTDLDRMPAPAGGFLAAPAGRSVPWAMDKSFLVEQLAAELRATARTAKSAMEAAASEARDGATPAEKREDARVMQENSGLARGHKARLDRASAELAALEAFAPPRLAARARVQLGAIVEVEDGEEGRTFFLAPVGAGVELTGPGGDGFLSVVTPSSPIGKAVLGRTVGETLEVVVRGESREWTITYVE